MNKIYKVIYNKARHSFVVVSELTRSHTKSHGIAGTGKKALSAMILSALLLTGASVPALAADNNVTYDSDNDQSITLNNDDGNGTKIMNVANGELAPASKEAVNGSQLYKTNRDITDLVDALNKNNSTIAQAQTDITLVKTQNIKFKSDINTLKSQVGTGWHATIDGALVKDITPSDTSLNFTAGDDATVTDPGNGSIKIGVKATGKVEDGNTHVVSGGTVYTAVNAEKTARTAADTALSDKIGTTTDGNYVKAADSVGTNLGTLDTRVKTNADAIAKEVKDRIEAITNITNNITSTLSDSAVQYDKDSNKATITLAGTSGTTLTNLKDANLSDTSTDAVTGKQLFAEQTARENAIAKEIQNRNDAITNSIGTLRGNAVLYDTDTKDLITFAGTKGTKLTHLKDATLSASSTDAVTGRQLYATNQNITGFSNRITQNASTLKNLATSVTNALSSVSAMSDGITSIDNTKADASLTNLSDAGKNVISEAAAEAVQKYMKSLKNDVSSGTSGTQGTSSSTSTATTSGAKMNTVSLTSLSKMSLAPSMFMTSLAATSGTPENVTYDSDNPQSITLNNDDGNGTRITNVADGQLAAASKDAVTGAQLYHTNTQITDLVDALNKNNSTIAQAQTDITLVKTQNITFRSDINTLKSQVGTGWHATIDGALVKNITPSDTSLNFTAGDDATVTDPGNGSIQIGVKATGKVEAGNTHVVTGDAVYQAIKDMPTDGTLSGKANTALDNINDAGKTVIKDLAKGSVRVINGTGTTVTTKSDSTGATTYAVNIDKKAIQDAVGGDIGSKADKTYVDGELSKKASADASNIDVNAYTKKLGTGKAERGSTGLVTGDTLYNAVKDKADKSYVDEGLSKKADKDSVYTKDETYNRKEIDSKVSGLTTDINKKADTDLGNITDAGRTVIKNLAQNSVKVINGKNTTVTEGMDKGMKTFAINVDNQAITDAIQPKLDEKVNKDLDNLTDKGKEAIKDVMKDDMAKKANVDASNLTSDAVTAWQKALGTGDISESSTGLVTGKTVYQALQDMPSGDGLVKYDKTTKTITVAANKDAATVDFSGKDSNGNTINRTITGITTNANDATSAANVGYVQDVAGNLATGVQRVANQLSHDINRVGAGAAALAGLHPGDFDPENKLDFAAGYGHYKGANAGALGAYYHPNEDTIVGIAGTMGNGDPMLSAGVTFKLGPSGPNTMSRTALTKELVSVKEQNQQLVAQNQAIAQKMAAVDQKNQQLEKDMAELKAQLAALAAKK